MRLEHYSPEKLKREILEIAKRYLDTRQYRIFFFGSRVSGSTDERSDIDVGIEGPPIPSGTWLDIQDEIENLPTLYKVDIVDFRRTDDVFRTVALTHTEDISAPRTNV